MKNLNFKILLYIIIGGVVLYFIFGSGKKTAPADTPHPLIEDAPVVKETVLIGTKNYGKGSGNI